MKKTLLFGLVSLLVLAGCSSKPSSSGSSAPTTSAAKTIEELTFAHSGALENMDYTTSSHANDNEYLANFVETLLENDRFGNLKGALAEKWEHNPDATVWTFHLREGVKWVTSTGEEYGTVKAEDFVTGLRHGAEFNSGLSYLLTDVLTGYGEYISNKDFSDEAWSKVGVKALDDKTVQFTLSKSTPYFDSMNTYLVISPVNKQFLESKGVGCKLGAPNKKECSFGSAEPTSILYNGPYILTELNAKSSFVFTKNETYWDSANVNVKKIKFVYDDQKDPYSVIKGFEQGTYQQASLRPSWGDFKSYVDKYGKNLIVSQPNSTTFGMVFNVNRKNYEHTNHQSEESKANARAALLNENFRKALRASIDAQAKLEVRAPKEIAQATIRNINNFPGAGQADGKDYFQLVNEAYAQLTGTNVDLSDGQYPWLNKDEALKYIEKAKAEGIKFPVHLDMMVIETIDYLVKEAQSLKDSIAKNTDNQIVLELVLRSKDTVENYIYRNEDPHTISYDVSTFTGWGPDYSDPKSFVDIYSPVTGYYMKNMGLEIGELNKVSDLDIKEKIGLVEYEKIYREADNITNDMAARYKAFAKADAFLVEKAIMIPLQQRNRNLLVSRIVPFQKPFSYVGTAHHKYKNIVLQDELITKEQYEKAEQEWKAARK